jgi:hypothetical protein
LTVQHLTFHKELFMKTRPLIALSIVSLFSLVACGDDTAGSGGAGGEGTTSSGATTNAATGTTTATSSTASSSGSGDGGNGAGGEGTGGEGTGGEGTGGTSACLGELPETYDGATFDEGAAGVLALRAQLGALNAAMLAAETDIAVTPTAAELVALYDAEDPSLSDGTSAYYDGVIREVFTAFEAAAGNEWTPADPPAGDGGIFGAYIFDQDGRDLRQWVEKGQFNSHFYPFAVGLIGQGFDQASLDALLAAYGAHPDFPGDSSADTATNPDRLAAQYAERRSPKNPEDASLPLDPENPGPYFTIKRHFITAQVALENGCQAEGMTAIGGIIGEWERVMGATVIYYLNDATLKLTADGATPADLASGLHGIGEATSFLHGFKEADDTYRIISDEEVDAFLALVEDPYRFVTDPAGEAPDLLDAIDHVAAVYGFSDADVEAFATNH